MTKNLQIQVFKDKTGHVQAAVAQNRHYYEAESREMPISVTINLKPPINSLKRSIAYTQLTAGPY